MIRHTQEVTIRRPVPEVFDFVATNYLRNHPRWEPEVLEVSPLTEGPMRVGSRVRMVRKDFGKVTETTNEVTELVPDRRIAFRHADGPMDFELSFTLAPVATGTRFRADVAAQPHGAMRLLTPVFKLRMPRTGARITAHLRDLIESEPLGSPV